MKKLQARDSQNFFIDGKGMLTIRMDRKVDYTPAGDPCRKNAVRCQIIKDKIKLEMKVA